MRILNNKNLTQKIIISIITMLLLFTFVAPNYSKANWGGVLFGPVIDLVAGIGDAGMALLQVFMDTGDKVQLSWSGFLVNKDEFKDKIGEYGMEPDENLKTKPIDTDELDRGWSGLGTYSVPVIQYSPEKIFSNQIPALDANFISPKTEGYTEEQKEKSVAIHLQETIASWYNALRNLVIVGLLSVLLYVGIRMMMTSVASDKAKYKKMLMDWIIALCLLFFLHYIMAFTMTFIEFITEGISGATDINVELTGSDGGFTYKTNLTGYCRMQVQYDDFGKRMVYLIFYIALVVYTFMFTWKYMKRSITIAFLTLIAPVVTLTYPIDKIGDGKAQAFNMWLKEFIFNALLQPFHLIIYSIFLGSSMDIATENPLFAIMFLAFITPAEKLLRKFFKFDQAATAGAASFAGGFGGAIAFDAVKKLINKGASGSKGTGKSIGGGNSGKVRTANPVTSSNAPNGKLDSFVLPVGARTQGINNAQQNSSNENIEDTHNYGDRNSLGDIVDASVIPEAEGVPQLNSNSSVVLGGDSSSLSSSNNAMIGGTYSPNSSNIALGGSNLPLTSNDNNNIIIGGIAPQSGNDNENLPNSPTTIRMQDDKEIPELNGSTATDSNTSQLTSNNGNVGGTHNYRDRNSLGGAGGAFAVAPSIRTATNREIPQPNGNIPMSRSAQLANVANEQRAETQRPEITTRRLGKDSKPIRQIPTNTNPKTKPNYIRGAMGTIGQVGLKAAKVAGQIGAAGVMGAVGAGIGITGGDLEDVIKLGAAGAGLGYATSPAMAKSIKSGFKDTVNSFKDTWERGAYGEETAALRQQAREFTDNKANREFFAKAMEKETGESPKRKELDQRMAVAAEYNNAGITDNKTINKCINLEKEIQEDLSKQVQSQGGGMTKQEIAESARAQAMTIDKLAKEIDKKDLRDENKAKQLESSFAKELVSKGMENKAAASQAKQIMAQVKKHKGIF